MLAIQHSQMGRCGGLVKSLGPQQITLSVKAIEHFVNVRVPYRTVFSVREQILLANISCVVAVRIFGKQMIKGLSLVRA